MGGKKRTSFSKRWASLTDIGSGFGLSGIAVGKLLNQAGWRSEDGQPSERAIRSGLAIATPLANGRAHFMWNRAATRDLLNQRLGKPDPVLARANGLARAILVAKRQADRYANEGQDKLGIFCWDGAVLDFGDAIKQRPLAERLPLTATVCQVLRSKDMPNHCILDLLEASKCGVRMEDVERHQMEQVTPIPPNPGRPGARL